MFLTLSFQEEASLISMADTIIHSNFGVQEQSITFSTHREVVGLDAKILAF